MLNISENSIKERAEIEKNSAFSSISLPRANRMTAWWLSITLLVTIIVFFLPWTQNIQMKGKVTTLLPGQRPQSVNSAIDGRIEKWYVREGELVQAGDTIVFLSEVKSEYFDPNLVGRTAERVNAKRASAENYGEKAAALDRQIAALQQEQVLKKEQLENKIKQAEFKIQSNEAALQQAEADLRIAQFQANRTDTLYQKGIKSLSDLENKRLKVQETQAKAVSAANKLAESRNDLNIAKLQLSAVDNEYANKISKAQSEKFATLSGQFEAIGDVNKLQNEYENYSRRNDLYYVIAPQTGYITKTIKAGIGEIVKAGGEIVTIVPQTRELAVEMYVSPMDLPLLTTGQKVGLIFDGWQAFVVSGWSNFTFGTYQGEITAIDNIPNDKNQYRILVKSADPEKPFPDLLRVGAGAQGIALLKDVPVWYEIWRQLNGFPADFYEDNVNMKEDKFKPPVKAVAK